MELLTFESLPDRVADEDSLEELLSRPTAGLVDDLARLDGDVMVLGVAGKVGPTLARMIRRAAPDKRVVGVARFSDPALRERLESWGIETIRCDLLEQDEVKALPELPNVVYMAGKKFGTEADKPFSWVMNTYVPALVAERFCRSRIVAFSTLCVYPFASVMRGGCDETEPLGPPGDYANSCVGRERAFQYFSARHGTPGRLARLNYAIDLRYGVLFDIASWVRNETPIDLSTGQANVIWQGDAAAQIVRCLLHCEVPSAPINIGAPKADSVRHVAEAFGRRFDRTPVFEGVEQPDCWVNRTDLAQRLFGHPVVPTCRMIDWVADWIERGMPDYAKPTRYEVRSGQF